MQEFVSHLTEEHISGLSYPHFIPLKHFKSTFLICTLSVSGLVNHGSYFRFTTFFKLVLEADTTRKIQFSQFVYAGILIPDGLF